MIFSLSTKFGIIKPWTNIQSLTRIKLGLWQASKQIYKKLQYKEKVLGEFQALPRFPRKMILYSWTKFGILKHWTNIPSLRRFDWGFWQTSKQICRKLQYKEKVFKHFQGLSRFPRKNGFVFVDKTWEDVDRNELLVFLVHFFSFSKFIFSTWHEDICKVILPLVLVYLLGLFFLLYGKSYLNVHLKILY